MILLLFSGGLDSMLLAERALASGHELGTLFFRYPHPAVPEEYRAVSEWLRRKRNEGREIRHIEITLGLWGSDSMATGIGEPGPRLLPARNQVMISQAINIAASIGAEAVWYGANLDDAADYPDCTPFWVNVLDGLARPWGVKVQAPLLYRTKGQIIAEAREHGIIFDRVAVADGSRAWPDSCCEIPENRRYDPASGAIDCVSCGEHLSVITESLSWSCYEPKDGQPCGTCNSCKANQ